LFISDNLQFGFKKNLICWSAIFVLTQVVEYFISHGNNVYLASLDATKALYRVHHIKLFHKLLDLNFPGGIIKIIFFKLLSGFMSNVLETISKLKLKNSKNHFSNLALYLPAYSYTGI